MDNKDALWHLLQAVKKELKVRINYCRDASFYGEVYLIRLRAYEKVARMNKQFIAQMVKSRETPKELYWLAPGIVTYYTVQQTINHYLYLLAGETKK